MRRWQWQQRLTAAMAPLVVAAGCSKTPSETPIVRADSVTPVSDRSSDVAAPLQDAAAGLKRTRSGERDAVPTGRYRVQTANGKVRVYFGEELETSGTLIRCSPVAAAPDHNADGDAGQAIAAWEGESTRLWLACKSRMMEGQFADTRTQHDAWLETAQRLEERLQEDADHLGVLRDLIVAYLQLLSFEASTPLGSNLCLLGGRRVSEFESRAAPLDPPDRQLVEEARGLIFYTMKLYPCAAELLRDSTSAANGKGLRPILEAFGQSRFTELEAQRRRPPVTADLPHTGQRSRPEPAVGGAAFCAQRTRAGDAGEHRGLRPGPGGEPPGGPILLVFPSA